MSDAEVRAYVERLHGPARLLSARDDPALGGPCFVYLVTTSAGERLVRAWRTGESVVVEAGRLVPTASADPPTSRGVP